MISRCEKVQDVNHHKTIHNADPFLLGDLIKASGDIHNGSTDMLEAVIATGETNKGEISYDFIRVNEYINHE
jgi:hypothetical protein